MTESEMTAEILDSVLRYNKTISRWVVVPSGHAHRRSIFVTRRGNGFEIEGPMPRSHLGKKLLKRPRIYRGFRLLEELARRFPKIATKLMEPIDDGNE